MMKFPVSLLVSETGVLLFMIAVLIIEAEFK